MKLSIVIPTREEEKAIEKTVRSLKEALGDMVQVIVSDGKSSDRTVEIARSCADVVVQYDRPEPHNAAKGRNDGAREATGEFLCFIDADTRIPEPVVFFERAFKNFADSRVVGVCGPQRAEPDIETWADRVSFNLFNFGVRMHNNILPSGEASGKFMLVRAESFKKVGGLREDLATREDGDFFYRLSRIGKTVYDPTLMVYHGARRAHAIGWWRLWPIWLWNWLYLTVTDKAHAKDWTPIR
jgi:glycosyltransferase involved in cell wall biosynthesis